jgi:hypothetical protein
MEYNVQKIIREIALGTKFQILEVNVPDIFPARRVFRYAGIDVRRYLNHLLIFLK